MPVSVSFNAKTCEGHLFQLTSGWVSCLSLGPFLAPKSIYQCMLSLTCWAGHLTLAWFCVLKGGGCSKCAAPCRDHAFLVISSGRAFRSPNSTPHVSARSSFYRAMQRCQGVVLLLDDQATPFLRIWCCPAAGFLGLGNWVGSGVAAVISSWVETKQPNNHIKQNQTHQTNLSAFERAQGT